MDFVDRGIGLSSNETRCIKNPYSGDFANPALQRKWSQNLEVQPGLRINHCCARGMSILRLARCLRWAVRLDAVRLDRNSAAIHVNRCQLHRKWPRLAGITTRRANFPKCLCSGFQYDVSLDGNILSHLCLEAAAHGILRSDQAYRAYNQRRSSGNRSCI